MASSKRASSKGKPGAGKAARIPSPSRPQAPAPAKSAAKAPAPKARAAAAAPKPARAQGPGRGGQGSAPVTVARKGPAARAPGARPASALPPALAAGEAGRPAPVLPRAHAVVENLQPRVDGGQFPAKAVPGEVIAVTADIFRDGHEQCEADLLHRKLGAKAWERSPMRFVDNDAWAGSFAAGDPGVYEFTVEARTAAPAAAGAKPAFADREEPFLFRPFAQVRVDPALAECSAWYEMWVRSQGTDPDRSASFDDCIRRLPDIEAMGFDVIYVPPIHPIGVTKRKGPDNSLEAKPGDPGCPYAIGNAKGGHKAVDPDLGTMADCLRFFAACRERGFALALDIALNCSPDHPYVREHPDWFYREPDGTIKCAENPPKRYEDVYPLNFFCEDQENLWKEIKSVFEFWLERGVTVFRVDNPHTKPFAFWEWLIADIKRKRPDAVFLSEAFTRPKVMKRLAKVGFDLSYTYFTWRTTAAELREYLEELTAGPERLYMKPIFFPTTPDILPWHLQNAPREAFKIRFALAATMAGAYGMYNGYELCENAPVPGKEEFLHSEKYQYLARDWDRPGNIKEFIARVNQIRKDHPALRRLKNLRFHACDNPMHLAYSKAEGDDVLLMVVNLDPHNRQAGMVRLDLGALGLSGENIFGIFDLLTRESYVWHGGANYVDLDPRKEVLHILKVEKF